MLYVKLQPQFLQNWLDRSTSKFVLMGNLFLLKSMKPFRDLNPHIHSYIKCSQHCLYFCSQTSFCVSLTRWSWWCSVGCPRRLCVVLLSSASNGVRSLTTTLCGLVWTSEESRYVLVTSSLFSRGEWLPSDWLEPRWVTDNDFLWNRRCWFSGERLQVFLGGKFFS